MGTARWRLRHPRTKAARHVAREVAAAAIGVLGVSALLRSLLPHLDWSWLRTRLRNWLRSWLDRLPHVDLPDIPWPTLPLPHVDLPDVPALPGWLQAVLGTVKWWIPILIAVAAAVHEVGAVRRRQTRRPAVRE